MRVTNQMLTNNFLRDNNINLENMSKIQSQMTSGHEVQKPSDDPFKVARILQINTDISANTQYSSNISDTTNFLDTTDTALGQVGNILQRVRVLLVSAGNGSYGTDEKNAIKDEINQKIGELSQVLNTNYDGKYIFGGTRALSKPTTSSTDASGNTVIQYVGRNGNVIDLSATASTTDAAEYSMIKSDLSVEISQGVTMSYNVSADSVLSFKNKSGNAVNLFNIPQDSTGTIPAVNGLFTRITSDLDSNNTTNLTGTDLSDLTDAISNVLRTRSEVGAKSNRMEDAKDKNDDENQNLTALLSKTEDIDITKKTMEYATMQTVYNASLQTSARVLQKTLLDYL